MRERRKELNNRRSQEQDVTGKETEVPEEGAGTVNESHGLAVKSAGQVVNGRIVSDGSGSGGGSPVGTNGIKSASA